MISSVKSDDNIVVGMLILFRMLFSDSLSLYKFPKQWRFSKEMLPGSIPWEAGWWAIGRFTFALAALGAVWEFHRSTLVPSQRIWRLVQNQPRIGVANRENLKNLVNFDPLGLQFWTGRKMTELVSFVIALPMRRPRR